MLELLKSRQGVIALIVGVVMSAVLLTACEGSPMALVHITALGVTFAMFFATLNMDKVRR